MGFRGGMVVWLVILAVQFSGLHWAGFQTVAWVKMVWEVYEEEGSFVEGVKDTLGGKRLCQMCKKVLSEKGEEKSGGNGLVFERGKFELFCEYGVFWGFGSEDRGRWVETVRWWRARGEIPDVPPPELAS